MFMRRIFLKPGYGCFIHKKLHLVFFDDLVRYDTIIGKFYVETPIRVKCFQVNDFDLHFSKPEPEESRYHLVQYGYLYCLDSKIKAIRGNFMAFHLDSKSMMIFLPEGNECKVLLKDNKILTLNGTKIDVFDPYEEYDEDSVEA